MYGGFGRCTTRHSGLQGNETMFRRIAPLGIAAVAAFVATSVAASDIEVINAPEIDVSQSAVAAGWYIRGDLGYEWDLPYRILGGVNWSYAKFGGRFVNMEDRLADAMKNNPKMRVLVCAAWRDLAVPPDSALYSINQLRIPDSLRKNIRVEYYESGHMMYLYQPDAEKLRRDLVSFIGQS